MPELKAEILEAETKIVNKEEVWKVLKELEGSEILFSVLDNSDNPGVRKAVVKNVDSEEDRLKMIYKDLESDLEWVSGFGGNQFVLTKGKTDMGMPDYLIQWVTKGAISTKDVNCVRRITVIPYDEDMSVDLIK